jgi:hypothetical protein
VRTAVGAWLLWAASLAGAHDLITAEAAERYLSQASAQSRLIASGAPAAERAAASYALGALLDEIRELLNRDLASHGRVQGLATTQLLAELAGRGIVLEVSPRLRRYPANLGYYRDALRLSPDGPVAANASLRLLQGYFYDSFDEDPLRPRDQSWSTLVAQLRLGERFLAMAPAHPEREEAQFILLVHYAQAARSAPDAAQRRHYAQRTHQAAAEFLSRYADSLRAAAVPVLVSGADPGSGP